MPAGLDPDDHIGNQNATSRRFVKMTDLFHEPQLSDGRMDLGRERGGNDHARNRGAAAPFDALIAMLHIRENRSCC